MHRVALYVLSLTLIICSESHLKVERVLDNDWDLPISVLSSNGQPGALNSTRKGGLLWQSSREQVLTLLWRKRGDFHRLRNLLRKEFAEKAHIKSMEQYQQMYDESINDPDKFWLREAEILDWSKKPTRAREYTWDTANRVIDIKWFEDGELNVSYNCLDRHLKTWRKNKAAIIWQGEPEGDSRIFTYQELHREVCKFANVLKSKGIKRGDRVAMYLPMIPELAIAMLACSRIGAIHSVVFGGFSAESLANRRTASFSSPATFPYVPGESYGLKILPMKLWRVVRALRM